MIIIKSVTETHRTCVRRFLQSDSAQCCDIINACLQNMTGLNMTARYLAEEKNNSSSLFKELSQYYSLVYTRDDIIVGLGCLDGNEIKRMYTHPSAQRQGVGRTILQALETEAKRQGILKIVLQSSPSAESLYILCGYTQICIGSLTIGDAVFHFVNMEKPL